MARLHPRRYTPSRMITLYVLGKAMCRFVHFCCFREVVLHGDRLERPGGYILACTHLSHLEPIIVSRRCRRQIDWMARIEFYRYHIIARLLDALDVFPVDRYGVPVRAIRTAIERVRSGKIVGIFPEGGVARGSNSVMHGASFKKGACVVAYRSGAPVVPMVMVGTDKLTRVGPWLPFKNARVWMIVGEPVYPRLDEPRRRVAREMMARELQVRYRELYFELCASCGLDEQTTAGLRVCPVE